MTKLIHGHILTESGFLQGSLAVGEDGRISAIDGEPVPDERVVRDATLPIVLPGFIDLHVHGGGGRDVMDGGDALVAIARCHARHGTTSMLATTMTAPFEDLRRAFEGVRVAHGLSGGSRVLGMHLEGPYINAGKLGAQPDFARPVSLDELAQLDAIAQIRLITLAPEVGANIDDIARLVAAGHRVQLGHSLATYEQAVDAMAQGAAGFTHLFNAMSPMHHREPGMVGAALALAHYAEIIPDMLHVHPGAIRAALRAIPCLYCVTDSTSATGMPDGTYQLGRQQVTKCLGGVRLADGTLAGSTLTMDQALRNLVVQLGMPLAEASQRTSTHAAGYLGLPDRGRLAPGAWADLVVLDRDLSVQTVLVEGGSVADTHGV